MVSTNSAKTTSNSIQIVLTISLLIFTGIIGFYYWINYRNDPATVVSENTVLVREEVDFESGQNVEQNNEEVVEDGPYLVSSSTMIEPLSLKFAENEEYEFYLSQEEGNEGGWNASEYKELFSKPFKAQVKMFRKKKDWDQWWSRTLQEFEFDFSKQEIPISMFEELIENKYSKESTDVDELLIEKLGVKVDSVKGYEADPWQSETAFHFFRFENTNKILILSNSNLYSYELCDANSDYNPQKNIYRGIWYFYLSCNAGSNSTDSETPIMAFNLPSRVPVKIYTSIGDKKIEQIKGDFLYYSYFTEISGVQQEKVDLRKIL